MILAFFSSLSQTILFNALSRNIHPEVGILFALVSTPSTGMFQAASAFLPSSFAMCFVMLGMSAFLEGIEHLPKALTYFSISTIIGWPFVIAMVIPQFSWWTFSFYGRYGISKTVRTILGSLLGPFVVLVIKTSSPDHYKGSC